MSQQPMRGITADAVQSAHNMMVTLIEPENLAQALGLDHGDFNQKMETAIEESLQTLRVLVGLDIPEGARVLEVGAGFGLASICLALMGFSVTALEPGGTGFEENRQVSSLMISRAGVTISHIDQSAETFDFSDIPQFDLIVSNNVLEHIPDVDAALSNLCNAMGKDGIMVHSCANYTFPFEPHFGIPLVPFAPRLTRYLIPKGIRENGVWLSLNFVTARQVRRNAELHGLRCEFRRGTMATSIRRLTIDEQFAERHALLALMVRNRIMRALVIRCLSLPVQFASPMDFVVGSEERASSKSVRAWVRNH
jgi:2-polyprenyl-3-methyl-5-hydroxy-6-metoxy-1,4-benzoquinol methylase